MLGARSGIDNKPLCEAFERSGLSACELALRLGYTRLKAGRWVLGDSAPVRRALGLRRVILRGERLPRQRFMQRKTALRYAKALGLDPVDIGL